MTIGTVITIVNREIFIDRINNVKFHTQTNELLADAQMRPIYAGVFIWLYRVNNNVLNGA